MSANHSLPRRGATALVFALLRHVVWPTWRFIGCQVLARLLYLLLPVVSVVLACCWGRAHLPTDVEEPETV